MPSSLHEWISWRASTADLLIREVQPNVRKMKGWSRRWRRKGSRSTDFTDSHRLRTGLWLVGRCRYASVGSMGDARASRSKKGRDLGAPQTSGNAGGRLRRAHAWWVESPPRSLRARRAPLRSLRSFLGLDSPISRFNYSDLISTIGQNPSTTTLRSPSVPLSTCEFISFTIK